MKIHSAVLLTDNREKAIIKVDVDAGGSAHLHCPLCCGFLKIIRRCM